VEDVHHGRRSSHPQAHPRLSIRPRRARAGALPHQWLQPFARRSGEPLVRLRLTAERDEVVLLYPSHCGGWETPGDFGAVAMPLDLALQSLSTKSYFLELRQTYG
jgi:hypothetical protein